MPLTLADGRIKLTALPTRPVNPLAITVAELTAVGAVPLDKAVMKQDYRLSAVASDTVDEAPLIARGNAAAPGFSNYEGNLSVFRYLDRETGLADEDEDIAWDLFKRKGTELWLVEREGPIAEVDWAVAQPYECWHVITDTPQKATDRQAGYIKRTVPLLVQRVWGVDEDAAVAAAA
jgi:hypothetical protein